MKNVAKNIKWDLSSLYKSISDPQIETDKKYVDTETDKFVNEYRGKISSGKMTPGDLKFMFEKLESILSIAYTFAVYANLLKSKNNTSHKYSRFHQQMEEFMNNISSKFIFIDTEIIKLPKAQFENYVKSTELKNYSHYLKKVYITKDHILSEPEEIVMTIKRQTGASAFVKFYDRFFSTMAYPMKRGKAVKYYNYSEITNILSSHKDRIKRKEAAESISKVYKENSHKYGFILNTLLQDKKLNDQLRKYKYPQQATYLSEEVNKEIVDTMSSVISNNYDLAEKFYSRKSKLLGYELHEWDRYSDIYTNVSEPDFSYDDAKELILDSFKKFSPEFHRIALKFFANNWIDAELNEGKSSGAFCAYATPAKNPFILTNFTGKANDVRTLAHELGHGIHAYLSREQTLLNYWPVTPIAEIASIFCENIVFRAIYNETSNKKQRINLLAGRIQEIFATVYRQNAFHIYETAIHDKRQKVGELSIDELSTLFQDTVQKSFGKGLKLTSGHKLWWIPISHFYHYNFYVFSYPFGSMLSNALYENYLSDGKEFLDNYIKVLKLGGAKNLQEITKLMKIDINSPTFWEEGLNPLRELIDEFLEITN